MKKLNKSNLSVTECDDAGSSDQRMWCEGDDRCSTE